MNESEITEKIKNRSPLVLIVDDIPQNLQLLSSILNSEGFHIAFASNGLQALEVVKNTKPDLILLDIMMPDMDGFEVCKSIKSNPRIKDIPILFLTGRFDPEDIAHGFEVGAVDYILKPFNATELLSRVRTHLELKLSRDRLNENNNQLKDYQEELKLALAEKDKFFSIISHDLRGPFGGLIGLTDLLRDDYASLEPDEIAEIAINLNKGARRLFNLLENLLEWSNAQLGRISFQPAKFDLFYAVEKILKLNSNLFKEKNIHLIGNVPKDTFVIADLNMISTVIRNFVSNSFKFTPAGGSVTISVEVMDKFLTFSIKDTGIGMDSATITKLFRYDSKISTPGTNNESGTGLGLLLCKELLAKHSTRLDVESYPGKGTKFSFILKKG